MTADPRSWRERLDPSVCVVLGPGDTMGREVVTVACAAAAASATLIQLRWKDASGRELAALARALVHALAPLGVPLVVNDRPDVARVAGAAGVHVGDDDLFPADARAIVGPEAIVGVSLTAAGDATRVDRDVVDYAGVGPVWATRSKGDAASPLGVDGLAAACARLPVPAMAIGGIDAERAGHAIRAGAAGVAVVSAVAGAPNPGAATRALARSVRMARRPAGATVA